MRYSVAEGLADYFASDPAYQIAFEMLKYGHLEPPVPGYDFVRVMVREAMAAIAEGADVTETLTQLTEDANINLAEQVPWSCFRVMFVLTPRPGGYFFNLEYNRNLGSLSHRSCGVSS